MVLTCSSLETDFELLLEGTSKFAIKSIFIIIIK